MYIVDAPCFALKSAHLGLVIVIRSLELSADIEFWCLPLQVKHVHFVAADEMTASVPVEKVTFS